MRTARLLVSILLLGLVAGCGSTGNSAGRDRNRITLAEIQESELGFSTAYDIVRQFRPQWLIKRGRARIEPGDMGSGDEEIAIYEDNIRLGGEDNLRRISAQAVQEIAFFTAAEALRLGPGSHLHGAIVVYTRVR